MVAAKVVDEDAAEFVGEGFADAVGGVAVDEGSVGDKGDDPVALDAVGGPPDSTDVGVVEAVLVRTGGQLRIRVSDGGIEDRVFLVLVVIVRTVLPGGVGRFPAWFVRVVTSFLERHACLTQSNHQRH